MFSEDLDEEDWRNLVKDQMVRPERNGSIRDLKDYDHIERGLYHRLHGEIMSRCVNEREGKKKQKELHEQTCGIIKKVIFYWRIQHIGYYWPSMSKNAAALQVKYLNCQLSMDREKSYVVFIAESVTNQVLQCLYKKKKKKN